MEWILNSISLYVTDRISVDDEESDNRGKSSRSTSEHGERSSEEDEREGEVGSRNSERRSTTTSTTTSTSSSKSVHRDELVNQRRTVRSRLLLEKREAFWFEDSSKK